MFTEERVREIIAEEIAKLSIKVTVNTDGYGSTFYVDAYLSYEGVYVSDSSTSFKP